MPTITVYKDDLYQLAELDPAYPLSKLDEVLALVKGELSARTHDGLRLRGADGVWVAASANYKLRIELKDTNRPDLWSVEGIARQLRSHRQGGGQPYTHFAAAASALTIEVDPRLETIRPFIGGFLVHGRAVDENGLLALIETQEVLTRNFGHKRKTVSIGVYDGTNLRFPVHYRAVARDGIRFAPLPPVANREQWPLDAQLTPAEILAQHPTGREYGWILADQPLVPLLTDAQGEVLSLPPIINSAGLGRVTPGMTALFVEMTGTELDHCLLALNIMATNLVDRGWQITPVTTQYPYDTVRGRQITAPHPLPLTQSLPVTEFERLLGQRLEATAIASKLRAYGVDALVSDGQIKATIPSYRQDYLHPVDVIEDYAISRGYETIAPTMQQEFTVGKLHPLTDYEDLVRDVMIGLGFEEAICNILTDAASIRTRMNVTAADAAQLQPFLSTSAVGISNVMNLNYAHLRDWVLPSLMEIESHSAGALYPHRLFEVGEVAVFDAGQNLGSRTEVRLAALIADDNASFDSAQSISYALLNSLGVAFSVEPWVHPAFINGRVARIVLADQTPLGFFGELAPPVILNWGGRTPIAALELSLSTLYEKVRQPQVQESTPLFA